MNDKIAPPIRVTLGKLKVYQYFSQYLMIILLLRHSGKKFKKQQIE